MPGKLLEDILHGNVVCIGPEVPAMDAVQLMVRQGVACVVVMDGSRPVGMITERSVVQAVGEGRDPAALSVRDLMTGTVPVQTGRTDIPTACSLMCREGIAHLVVVNEQGRCLGVISHADLARHLVSSVPFAPAPRDVLPCGEGKPEGCTVSEVAAEEVCRAEDMTEPREPSCLPGGEVLEMLERSVRSALTTIMGAHEILLASPVSEDERGMLKLACHAAENLFLAVNDVMDRIGLENGSFALDDTPFSLYDLTEKVAQNMLLPAREKGLDLRVRIDPSIEPTVQGDPDRLRRALTGLLIDALGRAHEGEIVLLVEKTGRPNLYRFTVELDGPGIRTDHDRIMSRQGLAEANRGRGRRFVPDLGLSSCTSIIRAMGGDVLAGSKSGSEMALSFTASLVPRSMETGLLTFREKVTHLKVLVVDGSHAQRHVLCEHLGALGLCFEEAETPAEARRLMALAVDAGNPHDLVLLAPEFVDGSHDGIPGTMPLFSYEEKRARPSFIIVLPNGTSYGPEKPLPPMPRDAVILLWPFSLARVSAAVIKALNLDLNPVVMTGSTCPPGPLQVLLADGDPASRVILKTCLEQCGCFVDPAANGFEAFDQFVAGSYDLVLLETDMPQMSGWETARLMRELEQEQGGRPVPILAVSSRLFGLRRDLLREMAVNALLVKPFGRTRLMSAINELFARAGTT